MRSRGIRLLVASGVLMVAACTFDKQVIAVPPSQVVVHAVLDPGDTLVSVLVERSLTGTINVPKTQYDALDPINSSGGVPARGAQVSITGPDGTTPGFEVRYLRKPVTYGAGRYVFRSLVVRPGKKYTLNVRTTDGIVVTGSTVVPAFTLDLSASISFRKFYRDGDTLSLSWSAVPLARTYGVRVESPFGAFQLFTDTLRLNLAGDLRNLFASDLPRVFIPGFQQQATVYAADTNFFDYYRSRNDPFTGSGIINRLDGGIGLFGSTSTITWAVVDVTQNLKDSTIEGLYDLATANLSALAILDGFRLYVETPAGGTLGASYSGWYTKHPVTGSIQHGMLGARDGERIELRFLEDQVANRSIATFVGRQSHDSLIGTLSNVSGTVVFRKRATP